MRRLLRSLFPILMMAEGDGGGDDDSWATVLPEAIQQWDEVKNSGEDAGKFWKQMEDMRSHLGVSIRIPGENAKEEDVKTFHEKLLSKVPGLIYTPNKENAESVSTFYNALGRPEKEDGYTIPDMDTKGVDMSNDQVKAFMPIAHKAGLTQGQFDNIVSDMTGKNVDAAVKAHTAAKEANQLLQNEWGVAYENNMKRIANAATVTGAPQLLIDAINAGNVDQGTAKWLLGIANGFKGKHQSLIDDGPGNQNLLSPEQAKKEISEIMNNKKHEYWNAEMSGHADAKVHVRELYKMAVPGGSQESGTVGIGGIEIGG